MSPRAASQETRIRTMLVQAEAPGWVCGTRFLAGYMPRYSAVIWTLRHKRGLAIEGRPCKQHEHAHNEGPAYEFRIPRAGSTSSAKVAVPTVTSGSLCPCGCHADKPPRDLCRKCFRNHPREPAGVVVNTPKEVQAALFGEER